MPAPARDLPTFLFLVMAYPSRGQVLALCRQHSIPVAVVLINGGAVAIDNVAAAAPAIVEAFYPSVRVWPASGVRFG